VLLLVCRIGRVGRHLFHLEIHRECGLGLSNMKQRQQSLEC
jgi:hypothetical protein